MEIVPHHIDISPAQFAWLHAVKDNMDADQGCIPVGADYFLKELERLTTDGKHPFDCLCAIHR